MSKALAVKAFNAGYRVNEAGQPVAPSGAIRTTYLKDGYHLFSIRAEGKPYRGCAVHRLAAYQQYREAYLDTKMQARHLDDDKNNNRPKNIKLGTHSQNRMDFSPEKRSAIAAKAARKFTDKQVSEWRTLFASGVTYPRLSAMFGVPKSTLSYYLSKTGKKTSWALPQVSAVSSEDLTQPAV